MNDVLNNNKIIESSKVCTSIQNKRVEPYIFRVIKMQDPDLLLKEKLEGGLQNPLLPGLFKGTNLLENRTEVGLVRSGDLCLEGL